MLYEITLTIIYKGIAKTFEQLEKITKEIEVQANKAGLKATITTEKKIKRG